MTGPAAIYVTERMPWTDLWLVREHMPWGVLTRSMHETREAAEAACVRLAAEYPNGGLGQGDGPARRRLAAQPA